MNKKTVFILLLLTFLLPIQASAGTSVGCDDGFVELSGAELVITVAPTGADDTANMQCALDAAIDLGVPVVRLAGATYSISHIKAVGYKGSLDGKTKALTHINVLNNSVNCTAMEAGGFESSAIVFSEGSPKLRFMTINAHTPCIGDVRISSIVRFTGESAIAENCDNDVIFGEIDRVVLEGNNTATGPSTGVSVSAEGRSLGGCKDTLLGTFKLNRSVVKDFNIGALISMRAGAQIDVNFNEFEYTGDAGVMLIDSNHNASIVFNSFIGEPFEANSGKYAGVKIISESASAPTSTRAVISNNDFTFSTFGESGFAVGVWLTTAPTQTSSINVIVDHNVFHATGAQAVSVYGVNVNGARINTNIFIGQSQSQTSVVIVTGTATARGWSIMDNNFDEYTIPLGHEIVFNTNTTGCVVGPNQTVGIFDAGVNNFALNGGIVTTP